MIAPSLRPVASASLLWLVCACGGGGGDDGSRDATTAGTSEATSAGPTSGVDTTSSGGGSTSASSTASPTTDTTSGTGPGTGSDESTGGGAACPGVFPAAWIDGTDCGAEPPIQVHAYDDDTFILRQSLCTNFEGPFMVLLFGADQVLLQDTGAGGIPIAATVQGIIDDWLAARGQASIELLVTHSHGHGDHTAGDGQFAGLPNTTVVGPSQAAVASYFGIADWPTQIVTHDLGGRLVDVIPIPGHQSSHIALYDHATGWLLTGDTLYPGRLYIADFPTYVESIGRLVDHTADLDVCHVLGTHIEMTTTPGQDFSFGATMHPDEHPLPLTRDHLLELRDAVEAMGGSPVIEAHDDFIVYPL
ncbi:MAG: MBL fold metallo-hydrolase [Myxococcales bacterium]|nr:MBL fold metallo-hydrolase [Myxococcales bacterium]